jgi:hypothetical protein
MVAGMNKAPLILTVAAIAGAVQFGCESDDDPAGSEAKPAAKARVSSSIAEGAQLANPIRWQARVTGVTPGDVISVRFLIDGKVAHVEQETPYQFAGLGNVLIPGTLGPGSHTFAVDARLSGGRRLTAASTATVLKRAHGVPPAVVGDWTRTVKPAEVRRTDDFRNPTYGVPLPVGSWKLRIGGDSAARYVDPTAAHDLTVGQVRFEPGGRLVVGNEIPNVPQASEGGFCPDTVGTGKYRWSLQGDSLAVHVLDDRECADRNSFWNGRFTR